MMFKRYEIDMKDALKECKSSEQFRRRLGSGRYTYVEKRFCLNQPKYIDWSKTIATLTPYAREHEDECCLQFFTTISGSWASNLIPSNFTIGLLTGAMPTLTVIGPEYHDDPKKAHEHVLQYADTLDAVKSLAKELPNNFPEMLNKLIENKGVKEEALAEASNLSEKTIQRLRHHEQRVITLETVMQLCIGLHLHPILSGYLLRAAGQHFMDTDLHNTYKFLLYSCYLYSVEDCNVLLESQGYDPLGRAKKAS